MTLCVSVEAHSWWPRIGVQHVAYKEAIVTDELEDSCSHQYIYIVSSIDRLAHGEDALGSSSHAGEPG